MRVDEGRFQTADGAELFYRATGEGPAIVLCNGLGVSTFFWHFVEEAFGGPYRVVVWDYRGHGKSSPAPKTGFSIEMCAADGFALMDHLGIPDAVLSGHSLGCQTILEMYRQQPKRVKALVPVLGGYGHTVETFFGTKRSLDALKLMRQVAMLRPDISQAVVKGFTRLPGLFHVAKALGVVNGDLIPEAELGPYLQHLGELDLNTYFQLAQDLQDNDATDLLPRIDVPTLVFGADRDQFAPLQLSEHMARTIPGAELCVLRSGSHAALVEQPQLMCLRLERFLIDRLQLPRMGQIPA